MNGALEHATVVEIDHRGVLIRGPSGSGKTALGIELLSRCRACGIPSALVADDYACISRDEKAGGLVAEVPGQIAGLIELRGFGVSPVGADRHVPRTALVLAVSLVPEEDAERVADPARCASFQGIDLPELALPVRSPVSSTLAVLGWLGLADKMI